MVKHNHNRGTKAKLPVGNRRLERDHGILRNIMVLDTVVIDLEKPWKEPDRWGKGLSIRSELDKKLYSGRLRESGKRDEAKALKGIKQGVHRALRHHDKQLVSKMVKKLENEDIE